MKQKHRLHPSGHRISPARGNGNEEKEGAPYREGKLPPLTPTEMHILVLVAQYRSCREIAGHLALSVKTVENRRSGIIQKYQLGGHEGLMRFALEWAEERGLDAVECSRRVRP